LSRALALDADEPSALRLEAIFSRTQLKIATDLQFISKSNSEKC